VRLTTLPEIAAVLRLCGASVWWLCSAQSGSGHPKGGGKQYRGAPYVRLIHRAGTNATSDPSDFKPATSWWMQRIGPWQSRPDVRLPPARRWHPGRIRRCPVRMLRSGADDPRTLVRIGTQFSGMQASVIETAPIWGLNKLLGDDELHRDLFEFLDAQRSGNTFAGPDLRAPVG
jgi:hypothetical protein